MNKIINNTLLVYKKSAYSIYFMERRMNLSIGEKSNLQKEIKRFKKAHDEHYKSVKKAEQILSKYGFNFKKCYRGKKINYSKYDLIITLGGDGTFLEATRYVKNQIIIGINSSPSFSVGKLCTGTIHNFEKIIQCIVQKRFSINLWPKLRLALEDHVRPIDCVNDILISHSNPAAMSRYYLKIGKIKEEQRNSGLWVATGAGSSGAIRSAGGKLIKIRSKSIQYMPRELYYGFSKNYRHKGGILGPKKTLTVTSLMRGGVIFIDGTHYKLKFPFNSTVKVSLSPNALMTVKVN